MVILSYWQRVIINAAHIINKEQNLHLNLEQQGHEDVSVLTVIFILEIAEKRVILISLLHSVIIIFPTSALLKAGIDINQFYVFKSSCSAIT